MYSKIRIAILALGILFPVLSDAQTNRIAPATPYFFYSTENDLQVYPNPVTGSMHIIMDELSPADIQVEVIDMNGNVARKYQYESGSDLLEVNMNRLHAGLYSVRVFGKGIASHNLKIVKE